MLLAIDVGNTHTVLGVFDGEELRHMWRVQTDPLAAPDEVRVQLHTLFAMEGIAAGEVDGVAMATVVPELARLWKQVARDWCGREALAVGPDAVAGLLDLSAYDGVPGADRLADAVAAMALYGAPVVVVDMGTATNIEVIDAGGRFRGGVIAPGLETSMRAMASRAALLPHVELVDPQRAIGTSTVEAIQIGVVYGQVDAIDGMVRRIRRELDGRATVVATGGFGPFVAGLSAEVDVANPQLTLQGLRLIFDAAGRG